MAWFPEEYPGTWERGNAGSLDALQWPSGRVDGLTALRPTELWLELGCKIPERDLSRRVTAAAVEAVVPALLFLASFLKAVQFLLFACAPRRS